MKEMTSQQSSLGATNSNWVTDLTDIQKFYILYFNFWFWNIAMSHVTDFPPFCDSLETVSPWHHTERDIHFRAEICSLGVNTGPYTDSLISHRFDSIQRTASRILFVSWFCPEFSGIQEYFAYHIGLQVLFFYCSFSPLQDFLSNYKWRV